MRASNARRATALPSQYEDVKSPLTASFPLQPGLPQVQGGRRTGQRWHHPMVERYVPSRQDGKPGSTERTRMV
jgi:hypothetical protein